MIIFEPQGTFITFIAWASFFRRVREVENRINIPCIWEENAKYEAFEGFIQNKYIDSQNHGYKAFLISEPFNSKIYFFENENSGAYGYLKIGDFIKKDRGKLTVLVKRGTEVKTFLLDFGFIEKK